MECEFENDIESNINCMICYNSNKLAIKYKCKNSKCSGIVCDDCFTIYITKNKKCIFCREELDINKNNYDSQYQLIIKHKNSILLFLFIMMCWYIAFFGWIFGLFKKIHK